MSESEFTPADAEAVRAQLQRPSRGVVCVSWRCPCGKPGVLATEPRLPDGTPFPTTYYLTCPRATAGCSTLEAEGMMAEMTSRLHDDEQLSAGYASAHRSYLEDRARLGEVPEIEGVSAGGMPDRVKCLHALVAHSLSAGPGVNPLGDEAVSALGEFWQRPCLPEFQPVAPAETEGGA